MRSALLLVPVLLLAACPKQQGALSDSAPVHSNVVADGDPGPMHARLAHLTSARDRLAAGRLEEARSELQWIAENEAPSMSPEAWRPHLEDLRDGAAEGAEAQGVADMALAIAQSARACGSCHLQIGSGPSFQTVQIPGESDQMARHTWSSDRMWEGLIGPDGERWRAAAGVLREEVVDGTSLYADVSLEKAASAAALHERVHELAELGSDPMLDGGDQAAIYASFLAACADCHTALERGPM